MSQLSDYQRCVERPQKAAYEARIAQLERELADEVTKSTGYYSMWESAASRADIAERELAEARAETALQSEAREIALARAKELATERDHLAAEVESGKALARQVDAVLRHLNGQAYSSTLSALNAFRASLQPGVKP